MVTRFGLLLCLPCLLWSCVSEVSFERASYEARLDMATCGNILNPNIYNPGSGPEGFIDYRGYFDRGFSFSMHRDFTCELSYQIKGEEAVTKKGTYASKTPNSGKNSVSFDGNSFELDWAVYYQLKLEWDIVISTAEDPLHTVALLHSVNVFTT